MACAASHLSVSGAGKNGQPLDRPFAPIGELGRSASFPPVSGPVSDTSDIIRVPAVAPASTVRGTATEFSDAIVKRDACLEVACPP